MCDKHCFWDGCLLYRVQSGCTNNIRYGFSSNAINSVTPSSATVSCEFHFKNIPGNSQGLSAGGHKHTKNKSHIQFRGNKRKEGISLLYKVSKT